MIKFKTKIKNLKVDDYTTKWIMSTFSKKELKHIKFYWACKEYIILSKVIISNEGIITGHQLCCLGIPYSREYMKVIHIFNTRNELEFYIKKHWFLLCGLVNSKPLGCRDRLDKVTINENIIRLI